jgi:ADP-heptose:LPS heptosyltransferase
MKQQTLRTMDRLIGQTACFLLTVLRRAQGAFGGERRAQAPLRKMVFLKLTEQGALVVAHAAVQRAIRRVGRENVYFCVFDESRAILGLLDFVSPDNIVAVRTGNLFVCVIDLLAAIVRLRKIGVDAVIDLEFFARGSAVIAYLIGAPRRVGLHRYTSEGPYRGDLMTHRVPYNPYVHTSASYEALIDILDRDTNELPGGKLLPSLNTAGELPRFVPPREEVERVKALLAEALGHAPGGPIIVFNPNDSDPLRVRKWAGQNYVALGKRLLEAYPDATLAIIGLPGESAAAQGVCRDIQSPNAVSLAGKTSLRDLVVLFTFSDVLVTSDGGPGHFASVSGIDIVALFGPETPTLFGPLGPRAHTLRTPLLCSPCLSVWNHRLSPCNDNVCMQRIFVQDVFDTVCRCLKARGGE